MKKYRPSNGTEGQVFYDYWCARCQKDINEDCPIFAASMAYDIDDERYPKEWVEVEDGPKCTAFERSSGSDNPNRR